jgi:hypothetical protein
MNENFVTLEELYVGSITNLYTSSRTKAHIFQFIKIGNTVLTIEYELIGE